MTPEWIKTHFPNASRAFIEANSSVPCGLQNPERKPDPISPLVKSPKVRPSRKGRVVVVVSILSLRRRFADDDNIGAGGGKSLRDCIAASLGVDDGDKRVKWEYGVMQTIGPEQTLVRISLR